MIGDLESCHWFADMFCVTHNQPEKECRKKAVDEWDRLRLKHEETLRLNGDLLKFIERYGSHSSECSNAHPQPCRCGYDANYSKLTEKLYCDPDKHDLRADGTILVCRKCPFTTFVEKRVDPVPNVALTCCCRKPQHGFGYCCCGERH